MTQPAPLRDQLKALEHLQELDLRIDQIKKNRSALPSQLRALDDQLKKVKAQLDVKSNAVAELEKTQRQTKAALELNQDRLTRSSARLEGVQNSQEFQAINKEIDQLKKMNVTLEDQSKKSNQEIETISKDLADIQTNYDKVKGERDSQAGVLSGQEAQFQKDLSSLDSERKQYTVKVDVRTLSVYERVRGARAGIGIVPAIGGRCKGCNMMVPPQLFNEVQKCLQVHACPSCNRILFVPVSEAKTAD